MSGDPHPKPGDQPPVPRTGSGVRSLVTNVLSFRSTADRIAAMPDPGPAIGDLSGLAQCFGGELVCPGCDGCPNMSAGYVAPDTDPA